MSHTVLRRLLDQQILSPLSYFFARFIAQQSEQSEDSSLALTAALVSECNRQGDVCVELSRFEGQPFSGDRQQGGSAPSLPPLPQWQQLLGESACVGFPGEHRPLILDEGRLYLARFWRYEHQVAQALLARAATPTEFDPLRLQSGLQRLFPEQQADEPVNWQKVACALAVSRRFAVISGGPGTGKTTTVIKVLALLLEQNPALQIQLVAPTGKAAARMVESIRSRKSEIAISAEIAALIPDQASTLHRLLAYDGRRFRHNGDNPLSTDCLVIDEASMIDLSLMARLLDAMPVHCRLILLGDRDQLASVDAGNVLGDITGHGQEIAYSAPQALLLSDLAGVVPGAVPQTAELSTPADAIALLRTSYRFHGDSGIGRLSRLVNAGDGQAAMQLLLSAGAASEPHSEFTEELNWLPGEHERLNPRALEWAVSRYTEYLRQQDVRMALELFNRTRVLCAMHAGDLGESEFNRRIEERLSALGLLSGGELCHGKPVMVTVNDYEMDLYNGDIGLLWRNGDGELRACFPQIDGGVRDLAAINLPQYRPAWALTVHKSQGSEFDEVLLVLPQDERSPLLSRELIYTGITRARQRVVVHGAEAAFVKGCGAHVQRSSGLGERLGWNRILRNR